MAAVGTMAATPWFYRLFGSQLMGFHSGSAKARSHGQLCAWQTLTKLGFLSQVVIRIGHTQVLLRAIWCPPVKLNCQLPLNQVWSHYVRFRPITRWGAMARGIFIWLGRLRFVAETSAESVAMLWHARHSYQKPCSLPVFRRFPGLARQREPCFGEGLGHIAVKMATDSNGGSMV